MTDLNSVELVDAGVARTAELSELAEVGWTTASEEDPLRGEGAK
jgi:hypothetical protein